MSENDQGFTIDDDHRRVLQEILDHCRSGQALPEVGAFRRAHESDRRRLDQLVAARLLSRQEERYRLTLEGLRACASNEAKTAYHRCAEVLVDLRTAFRETGDSHQWTVMEFGQRFQCSTQDVARIATFLRGVDGLDCGPDTTGFIELLFVREPILDFSLPEWPKTPAREVTEANQPPRPAEETVATSLDAAFENKALRRSRVQLLDLQRALSAAVPASFAEVSAHAQDFAGSLSSGPYRDELLSEARTVGQAALSEQRRQVAVRAVASLCRRLHRQATFQASPPIKDATYEAFLSAALHEDGKLGLGQTISLHLIEKRSSLPVFTLHAAAARALDEKLAYVSDVDDQAYSIQLNQDDLEHTLDDLSRRVKHAAPPSAAPDFPTHVKRPPAEVTGVRPIRILHISDLHERAPFAGMPQKREALLDLDREERGFVLGPEFSKALHDVAQRGIDLVCFTGDLADWGHPAEYVAATARFEAILKVVGVPKDRFFAVPGNHDVQRGVQSGAWRSIRDWHSKTHGGRLLGRWFRSVGEEPVGLSPSCRDEILERTAEFWNWLESFRGPALRPRAPRLLGYRTTLPIGTLADVDVPVHVVGLDSAWLCGGDDDQGRILVTEEQVQAHIREGEQPLEGLRIALVHHPLDHLADHHDVRRLLADNGVDLLLHGHQHVPLAMVVDEPGARLRVIAAGCLMEGDLGKNWPNGFQLIEVEPRSHAGSVHFRKWSREGRFWALGTDLYRDAPLGRLEWPASDALGPPTPP